MSGPSTYLRRAVLVAAAAITTLATAPLTTAGAAPGAAGETFGYLGSAFGTSVTVLGTVTSDPTAQVSYGCGTPAGFSRTATSAGVSVPPSVLTTGTIDTSGSTFASPPKSTTSSRVEGVNVLGGLVTANAVTSVSASSKSGSTYKTSAQGTRFAGLRVLGLPVLIGPAPNTRIDLPGIGYVILNEQTRQVTGSSAQLRVTAIRAEVTEANLLGFEIGTTVVVAQAYSALTAPTGGFLGGFAFGTTAKVGPLLTSAPSFRVNLPCQGTNGVLRERNGAGIAVPGILDSGTIRNTAIGSTTATTASAETTSTVETISLLDGLVEATGVVSVASADRASGTTTVSDEGSQFLTVTVAGEPLVVAEIEPNTVIELVGIGTLTLRKTIITPTSIEVRALELEVLQGNPLGVPIGTVVQVAVAKAVAR